MFTPRILRRRGVLAVIFGCSLLYFISSIYRQTRGEDNTPQILEPKIPLHPFRWQSLSDVPQQDTNPSILKANITFKNCRNSVQGKQLITDDRGYICERDQVALGGCCNADASTTRRYVCDTCLKTGCCNVYEHCVSCCLQPEKQPLLRKILSQASDSFRHLFASVTDHFELCLTKCRTSSQSVQHENSYRDPEAKFCYGEDPPDIQPLPNK